MFILEMLFFSLLLKGPNKPSDALVAGLLEKKVLVERFLQYSFFF